MKLAEVEPRDVKRFIGQLIALGLTSNSVRRRLAPLRALFATAVEDGLIRSNPSSRIRIPRSPADRPDDKEPCACRKLGFVSEQQKPSNGLAPLLLG